MPIVIVVRPPPTASEEEAVTYEPVVKVVVLMLHGEVVAMIKVAMIEMAFADSRTTPAANAARHMRTTPATAHMATTARSRKCTAAAVAAAAAPTATATAN